MNKTGVIVCLCFFLLESGACLYSQPASNQANSDGKHQENVKTLRKRLRTHLKETRDQLNLSKTETDVVKTILDKSVSDRKAKKKTLSYIRKRYAANLDDHMENGINGPDQRYRIRSSAGTDQDTLGLLYLLYRGGTAPMYEFMHLSNEIISTEFAESQLTVAGKWTDDKWKSIWFDEDLLQFHLSRITLGDQLQYLQTTGIIDSGTNYLGWSTIHELKRLKKHYGSRKRFQQFVFHHPLRTFTELQWKKNRIGVNASKEDVIELYIDYGRSLIDDEDRRLQFYNKIRGRLPEEMSDALQEKINE